MKKTFKIFMFMVAIVVFVGMVPSSSKAATTAKNYKTSNVTVKDTKKKTVNTYKATKKKIKKVTCSNKNVKIKVAKNKKSFTIVAKKSMNKTVKVCVKFTNKKTKVYKVKFTKKNNSNVTSEDTEDTSDKENDDNNDNKNNKNKDDRDRHEHTWVAVYEQRPIYEQHLFNNNIDMTQAIRDFNTMNGTDIFYTMTDIRQNTDGIRTYLESLGIDISDGTVSKNVIVGYDQVLVYYECSTCHETK